jgi:NADH-quinone oxidoreductase subunit C
VSAIEHEAPTAPGPELSDAHQNVLTQLEAALGDAVIASEGNFGDLVVRVRPDAWLHAARFAKDTLECDYLSFVAGIDWMPAPVVAEEGSGDTSSPAQPRETTYGVTGSDGRFQLLAHVESTRRHFGFTLKTDVDEQTPTVQSWVPVYPGADWHERETWEMYGIAFEGHPSLRHLYLPFEFEGHPLRKDYPLLAREVKPWPGLVDVEGMPGDAAGEGDDAAAEGGASE